MKQAQRFSLNYVLNDKPFQQPSITLGSQSIEASTKITSCNAFSTAKSKCSTSNIARRNIAVRITTAARTSGTNSINKILTPIVGKTVNDGCIKKTMSTLLGFYGAGFGFCIISVISLHLLLFFLLIFLKNESYKNNCFKWSLELQACFSFWWYYWKYQQKEKLGLLPFWIKGIFVYIIFCYTLYILFNISHIFSLYKL